MRWALEPALLRGAFPCIMDVALDLEEMVFQANRQKDNNPGGKVSLK